MSLLIKGGIERLSELIIDADKDWQAMGITNIRQLAAAMAQGDIVVRGPNIIQKISAGLLSYVLTSAGPGNIPSWMPAPGPLEYYIPAWIYLSHNEAIVAVDESHNENAPIGSVHVEAYLDAPADNIRRLDRAVALTDAEAIVAVDQSHNENTPVASECALQYAVGGAKLYDEGTAAYTDYTAEINSVAANDVKLLPDAPLQVNDAFYFGLDQLWDQLWLNIGVGGGGNWMLVEEYWDGVTAAWEALTMLKDNTNQFMVAGRNQVRWTRPGDWAQCAVDGVNLYWMRFRISAVVDYLTQPLGTQGWCEVIV